MNLWWTDYLNSYRWSDEERRASKRIGLIAIVFLVILFYSVYGICLVILNEVAGVMLGMIIGLFGGFYLSRRLCLCWWPVLMKAADEKAEIRLLGAGGGQ